MLSENIRNFRKAKGLSQEELAAKLNVVRQTVSKWETGLSVPDAELLVALSEALETPVGVLLGETAALPQADDIQTIAERLEVINLQLARQKETRRKALHLFFVLFGVGTALLLALLVLWKSPYLNWDYADPETAVFGAAFHAAEYLFVRAAPLLLAGAAAGAWLTRGNRR